jgi:hypothetical protein
MNPHISLPRPTGGPSNFGSTPSTRRNEIRMPRFFKRLFKFPQMDFEMAIWEMMSLIIAPKKVFRSIYYHVRTLLFLHWFTTKQHYPNGSLDPPQRTERKQKRWNTANAPRNKPQKPTTAPTPPSPTSSPSSCS